MGGCWECYTEFGCCASGQPLVFYRALMPLPVGSPMKGAWFPTCARSWCFAGIKAGIILGLTFRFGFLFDFCFGPFSLLVWATWSCQGGLAMTLWRLVGLSELVCRSAGVSRHSHSNNSNNSNNNNNSKDKVCKTPCGSMWRYVDAGDKIIREINWFEGFRIQTTMWTHMQRGEAQLTWTSSISSQFACTCAWYWFLMTILHRQNLGSHICRHKHGFAWFWNLWTLPAHRRDIFSSIPEALGQSPYQLLLAKTWILNHATQSGNTNQ